MNVRPSRTCQVLAMLLTSVVALFGMFGSPAGATAPSSDGSSSPDNYTFEVVRTVDTNGTDTYADDVTTFTYTLVAAPGTSGGAGISHAVVAAFCVTPIGYTAGDFQETDGSTGEVGLKVPEMDMGESISFDFDGNYDEAADGASIVIKQGDGFRTVTLAGPACPANEDPDCAEGEELNESDECVPVCAEGEELNESDECVPVCAEGEELNESDECVPVCAEGEELNESDECVPVCAEGEELNESDECVPVCAEGEELNESDECVPVCAEGEELNESDECVPVTATCPDGTEPMSDVNGDQVIDEDDCDDDDTVVVVLPEGPMTPNVPTPSEPETPTEPTEPVVEVEEDVVVAPTVTPTAPTPTPTAPETPVVADTTEVLGSQVTSGTLPRTGAATPVLAALGALLLLSGASLRRVSRGLAEV